MLISELSWSPSPGIWLVAPVGGLEGRIYPAGGTSIGNALVFGRIAGIEAAGADIPIDT
jgi:hypothetical protein